MLMPRIQWDRKRAATLPFERALGRTVVPYRGCAAPGRHRDDLFVELALHPGAFPRIDLANVAVGDHLIRERTDRPLAVLALPVAQRFAAHVLNELTADDRHGLGLDPILIRTVFIRHELDVRMDFKLFLRTGHKLPP